MTLLRNHTATPAQQRLASHGRARRKQVTQADALLQALRQARTAGRALELPEIMTLGIARGFVITNETERAADGRVLSRYWLLYDPERDGEQK